MTVRSSSRGKSVAGRFVRLVLAAGIAGAGAAWPAAALEPFPVVRPSTRAQAVSTMTGGGRLPVSCLSPMFQSLLEEPGAANPAAGRAMGLLQLATRVPSERRVVEPDGTTIRYTIQRGSFDRLDASDENGDGRPDFVEAVLDGLGEARRVLGDLGLPAPDPVEVLLVKLGSHIDGYTIPAGGVDGRPLLVLDVTSIDAPGARKVAAHQYAHAFSTFMGGGIGPEWGEALATWTVLRMGS